MKLDKKIYQRESERGIEREKRESELNYVNPSTDRGGHK